jgi:hypothetical protein
MWAGRRGVGLDFDPNAGAGEVEDVFANMNLPEWLADAA